MWLTAGVAMGARERRERVARHHPRRRLRAASHRAPRRLLPPAQPRVLAGARRSAAAGATGAHPAAFPLQHAERRALAHPQGSEARGSRARGPRRALPDGDGRREEPHHARAGARPDAAVPEPRAAAARRAPRRTVEDRGGAARRARAAAPPAAARRERRLSRHRAGHRPRDDRDRDPPRARPGAPQAHQPVPPRAPAPPGEPHGARQHPRAARAPLRRRGEARQRRAGRELRDRDRDPVRRASPGSLPGVRAAA